MRRLLVAVAALLAIAVAPTIAHAHRLNAAITMVEISPKSGRLVVSHRLYAHDLEHVLFLGAVKLDYFDTPEGKKALGAYVQNRFSVADGAGKAVALGFRGAETEGDLVWAYFDAPRPTNLGQISVNSSLLHDYADDQVNTVTVTLASTTRSAVFPRGARTQTLVFPTSPLGAKPRR